MKVYVLQKGHYSDTHIIGVVIDKNTADTLVEQLSSKDEYYKIYYQEFDTDQFIGEKSFLFDVWYDEENWEAEYDEYNTYNIKESEMLYPDHFKIIAKTKEEAIKIAQDMRAEYMAEQEGI